MNSSEQSTSPPSNLRHFLRNGERPLLVNGRIPRWTTIGDGWSYFTTDDQQLADGLVTQYVRRGIGGVMEATQVEVDEKKSSASVRQLELESRKGLGHPTNRPRLVSQPLPKRPSPVAAAVAGGKSPRLSTIILEKPVNPIAAKIISQSPPLPDVTPSQAIPKAEPIPSAPDEF